MQKVTPQHPQGKKILDQVSDAIRLKHYSYRTEQTYREWVKRYILFHNKRHPSEMGAPEVQAFLSHLATEKKALGPDEQKAVARLREITKKLPNGRKS